MDIIKNHVKELMNHVGHPYSHVLRVYNTAMRVSKNIPNVDYEVLKPAVLLHDMARAYEKQNKGTCHAEIGAQWAKEYLEKINYNPEKIPKIVSAIRTHRYSTKIVPENIEGKILQECDRLDGVGAIGIIRTTVHNHLNKPYHETDPLARNREINDWEYGIDHFFFKLLKIKDEINISEIKKEAQKRHDFMLKFLEGLENEILKKEEGEFLELLSTIRENYLLTHYEIEDPFNKENKTIVSEIMKLETNFSKEFIEQLKTEIL